MFVSVSCHMWVCLCLIVAVYEYVVVCVFAVTRVASLLSMCVYVLCFFLPLTCWTG